MSNEPVAYGMFKDGEFYDAIHPKQYTEHIGSYTIPLYIHEYERPHNTVLVPCDKLAEMQAEIDRLTMLCDCMTTESNRKGNEIEALNELNTMLKDAIEKRIEMDANRYQWLRAEFAAGRETYLAEGIPSGESLDKYIDGKLK